MKSPARLTPQEVAAWLNERAQAHRKRANYYAAIYIHIKSNSNTITTSDAQELNISDDMCRQHLIACAALEDAAVAMLMGRGPVDLGDPAIYPKDGTHGS
jgi:hypothetical protein